MANSSDAAVISSSHDVQAEAQTHLRRVGSLGEIVYRDPAELTPYEHNSRKHSDKQVRQIRTSIDEFGFTQPILLRERGRGAKKKQLLIGAGHGRQLAAMLEPKLDVVPTILVSGLTDKQWRGLIIADNKLALNAEWDLEMLAAEMADLSAGDDFDVTVLGFTNAEIADLEDIGEPISGNGTSEETVTCPKCLHRFVPE